MKEKESSRRTFLAQSGSVLGAAWLSMSFPAMLKAAEKTWETMDPGHALRVLTEEEAAELDAITAQIFPTDETPGAHEVGVVQFFDRSFESFNAGLIDPVRKALDDVSEKTSTLYPGIRLISSLDQEGQLAVMKAIESEPYFGLIRYLTIVGMFSHPSYGGNRDRMGWKLIGFDDRHAWQPPFGYYDANFPQED